MKPHIRRVWVDVEQLYMWEARTKDVLVLAPKFDELCSVMRVKFADYSRALRYWIGM